MGLSQSNKLGKIMDNLPPKSASPYRLMPLVEYRGVTLYGSTLLDLIDRFGENGKLDHTTANGNRVICSNTSSRAALKSIKVHFRGPNNTIRLGRVGGGIVRLDIACIDGSEVSVGNLDICQGTTIMSSHRAKVALGAGCMLSREIMIYASGAHGLFRMSDGERRGSAQIEISDKVWIGQGARILAGARVGAGSVIGSYSVLAGKIPNNCAAAGNPCRVTTEGVFWTAENIQGNYYEHLERREDGKTGRREDGKTGRREDGKMNSPSSR